MNSSFSRSLSLLRQEKGVSQRKAAGELGIREGDRVRVTTDQGSVILRALPTPRVPRGMVQAFHGYREADVNDLISEDRLDPYTGFPGYRSIPCSVEKMEETE